MGREEGEINTEIMCKKKKRGRGIESQVGKFNSVLHMRKPKS